MEDTLKPFENIGLCFSGGGFRATFFSLGVISYLNSIHFKKTPLLENVKAMSSVSGGTLLALAYAKEAQAKDFDFNAFYRSFYSTFEPQNDTLLNDATQKLVGGKKLFWDAAI